MQQRESRFPYFLIIDYDIFFLSYNIRLLYKGGKISCVNNRLIKASSAGLTWSNLSHRGWVKPLEKYQPSLSFQCVWLAASRKPKISPSSLTLVPAHAHLVSLGGRKISFGDERWGGGTFSPGAVTVALHTRINLKRQVNCCSHRINRAIYSAHLSRFHPPHLSFHSSVSPSLSLSALSFFPPGL